MSDDLRARPVRLCMQCVHRQVDVPETPCRLYAETSSLSRARADCQGDDWSDYRPDDGPLSEPKMDFAETSDLHAVVRKELVPVMSDDLDLAARMRELADIFRGEVRLYSARQIDDAADRIEQQQAIIERLKADLAAAEQRGTQTSDGLLDVISTTDDAYFAQRAIIDLLIPVLKAFDLLGTYWESERDLKLAVATAMADPAIAKMLAKEGK